MSKLDGNLESHVVRQPFNSSRVSSRGMQSERTGHACRVAAVKMEGGQIRMLLRVRRTALANAVVEAVRGPVYHSSRER